MFHNRTTHKEKEINHHCKRKEITSSAPYSCVRHGLFTRVTCSIQVCAMTLGGSGRGRGYEMGGEGPPDDHRLSNLQDPVPSTESRQMSKSLLKKSPMEKSKRDLASCEAYWSSFHIFTRFCSKYRDAQQQLELLHGSDKSTRKSISSTLRPIDVILKYHLSIYSQDDPTSDHGLEM